MQNKLKSCIFNSWKRNVPKVCNEIKANLWYRAFKLLYTNGQMFLLPLMHILFFETFSDYPGEHEHEVLHKLQELMSLKGDTKF